MELSYHTISAEACDEFVEKRSRFIGTICPVSNEKAALEFINTQRKKYWNATHNVYAYVLRQEGIRRFSDDGEPQGTAGMPALDVLLKENITDCAVVVTRYFGGVLLGTGGLVRAYSHGAKIAIDAGGLLEMRLCDNASIVCDYSQYGQAVAIIPERGGIIKDTIFTDKVKICFLIPKGSFESMQSRLTDFSAGKISISIEDAVYVPIQL